MPKDKSKKTDETKGEKKAKKGGAVDSVFAKPSEAPATSDGWNMTEKAEGHLLLITPLREDEAETKDYGAKPVIVADVVDLDGLDGESEGVHNNVFIFGGYLRGSLRGFVGERKVLARLVRGTKKERGNFPWLFEDADEDDVARATAYLESVDPFKQ